jgi:hypothetical protein
MGAIRDRLGYAIGEVYANGLEPRWWRNRLITRVGGPLLRAIHGEDGVAVMEEDWDTLLVLDACRADAFEETIDRDRVEDYRRVSSLGTSSPEWTRENFAGETFGDTVYVSANPWIAREAPDAFHHVANAWADEEVANRTVEWDEDRPQNLGVKPQTTVSAGRLNDVAMATHETYPNKRLIVHYFQPHAPNVGNPDGSIKDPAAVDVELRPGEPLRAGTVSRDAVWEAYTDNLAYVFEHASELAADLGDRIVLTADHGELFGEWLWPVPLRGYAHPSGVRHPALTEVPWATIEHGERRRIVDDGVTHQETDESAIDERLRTLGYKV